MTNQFPSAYPDAAEVDPAEAVRQAEEAQRQVEQANKANESSASVGDVVVGVLEGAAEIATNVVCGTCSVIGDAISILAD